MTKAKCSECNNPNIGTIKEGRELFLKKHNRSNGKQCPGSFSKVGK